MVFDFSFIDVVAKLVEIIGGGGVAGTGGYFLKKYSERTIVKLVTKKNDPDLEDFITLYDEVIEENTRISPDEITKFIGNHKPTKKRTVCDFLFICKKQGKVIGFLKAIYCAEKKTLFIAYLGIDKENKGARKQATFGLYNGLRKVINAQFKDCKAVVFEVETNTLASAAKLRLFGIAAERFHFPCLRFDIDYFQPEMPSDKGSISKEKTALMYIPLDGKMGSKREIDKKTMLDYLDFIYTKIYARVHDDKELNQIYKMYLDDLIKEYRRNLPDKIKLK